MSAFGTRFSSNTHHTNPVVIPSIERHLGLLQTYFGDVMATITWECHVVTLPWARVGASTSTAANNANIGIRILSEKNTQLSVLIDVQNPEATFEKIIN